MSQVRAGGAYVELTARSAQFLKGLEAAQKRLKSFGASTRLVGTKLTGLGVAAAAPVGASLAVYTSFDDAIRAAGAAANATGATLESLRNKAKHLGATTSFSASEVASLMTELGRAGFSPKQIEEMTGAVMNLARATGTDATVSSGIMSATIRISADSQTTSTKPSVTRCESSPSIAQSKHRFVRFKIEVADIQANGSQPAMTPATSFNVHCSNIVRRSFKSIPKFQSIASTSPS